MGAFEFYLQETLKDLSENSIPIDLKPEQGTAIKSLDHGQDVLAILQTGFDVNIKNGQAKHDSYGSCHLYVFRLFFGLSTFLSLRSCL